VARDIASQSFVVTGETTVAFTHAWKRRMRRLAYIAIGLGAQHLASCSPQFAFAGPATVPEGFFDNQMASGLAEPVGLAAVPDAFGSPPRVLFVEQRTARVAMISGGTVFTVGTVPGVASVDFERGLLGVAVDPNFPSRPYLYVHCTDGRAGHTIAISRFTLTGDLTHAGNGALQFDPASRYDLLDALSDNAPNHNGGTVRFGPDHMLYVSLGDDLTGCLAQDPAQLVGKILRLDVSRLPAGPGGPPPLALLIPPGNPFPSLPDSNSKLVWTVGLRNPFRFHIDDRTGALEIADVGQDTYEELDLAPSAGMDMGWPLKEASSLYASCSQQPPSPVTSPIHYYDHSVGLAIMSAGVYRQRSTGNYRFGTEYDGDCFLIDYYSGMMRRLKGSGSSWSIAPMVQGQTSSSWGTGLDQVSDVLETADGALWYCRQAVSGAAGTGEIRRIGRVQTTSVPGEAATFSIEAPRPSPSAGVVTLGWTLADAQRVELGVYDVRGRRVRALYANSLAPAGRHETVWDGRDDQGAAVDPGLYFMRLRAGEAERSTRITLVR